MAGRGREQQPTTPVTRVLAAAGVGFTVHTFGHDPRGATAAGGWAGEATAALGLVPARVLKTLVVAADAAGPRGGAGLAIAVVPADAMLDLKALAAVLGGRSAALADPAQAERATGYVVGGISPVGGRRPLPTVIDISVERWPSVFVSAGRRGVEVEITPADLVTATAGRLAPITRS